MENIRPVVVSGKVVPQLHLDAELEIALRVEDAFFRAERSGDDAAVGRHDHAAAAAIGTAQEFFRRRAGFEHLDHALVDGAAGRDHERLAHLGESLRIHRHPIA